MTESLSLRDLGAVLGGERLLPTLTRYNRLESRPYTDNFTRALRAEVRDPLWMLCKQWQLGEFAGDDAGSPVTAKLHVDVQKIATYQPVGGPERPFEPSMPLEARVERRPIPLAAGAAPLGLDLRLQMGRRWLKMIPPVAANRFRQSAYLIPAPDPQSKADAAICAHPDIFQQFSAVADRAIDGGALYLHLKARPENLASDGVAGLAADQGAVDDAGPAFVAWVERLFVRPDAAEGDAWQPDRLEYGFACRAPDGAGGDRVLAAEQYHQGRLDWYSFDLAPGPASRGPLPAPPEPVDKRYTTRTFIPAPARFNGMPDTRWWAFEDGKTNFGDIRPGTTDLAKLLLMEFGLVYANDWFILPYTVESGSLLKVKGLAVSNSFGERFWIEAAGRGPDDAWQRWTMFTLNVKGRDDAPADLTLLMLPTVPKSQDGPPLESVAFTRDEMANMVWAIETTIPTASGWPRGGAFSAAEFRDHLQKLLDAAPPPPPVEWRADIRYDIMTTVPEHWIPFVPEHIADDSRQIQLRRAAMPRFLANDPAQAFERVRPRTTLLREGLDARKPYRIHEEEVPRSGAHVEQAFQRTRWSDGRVVTWFAASKRTGRGEGHSGLAFDRTVPTPEDQRVPPPPPPTP